MASIEDILAAAERPENRRTAVVRILLDKQLGRELEEANAAFEAAAAGTEDEISKPEHVVRAAEVVEEVGARVEAAKVEFRFEALNGQDWLNLMGRYPPTKDQRETNPFADHNPDTFPAAAIAASCVDPEMTVKQAGALLKVLGPADYTLLWGTCLNLHRAGDAPKHPMAAGLIRLVNGDSGPRATTTKSRGRKSSGDA